MFKGKDLETASAGLTQRASEHDLCKALCGESVWFDPVACRGERDERDGGPGHPSQGRGIQRVKLKKLKFCN